MDEDLKTLAETALDLARKELMEDGTVTPTFIIRTPEGVLEVVRFDGAGSLFNSGEAKDHLFGAMRRMVKERRITAVVFVTEAWAGKQTAKGKALPHAEFMRRTSERGFATAVRDGLVERTDVIVLTAQTPAGTLVVQQEFMRNEEIVVEGDKAIVFGERQDQEVGPDEFTGRQKMYGDLREENLR